MRTPARQHRGRGGKGADPQAKVQTCRLRKSEKEVWDSKWLKIERGESN